MKLTALIMTVTLLLIGCVQAPHQIMSSINENELAPYLNKGTGAILGQAFLKTRGGDVKYGAGSDVHLMPVCNYTTEYISAVSSGKGVQTIDHRLNPYMRKTMGDGAGRFEFLDLPGGSYYVVTAITWETATGYKGSAETTGGVVHKRVSIMDGEEAKVILTR